MRTDPNKSFQFTESSAWNSQRYSHKLVVPDETGLLKYRVNSFSGHEANHFFLQHEESFVDLTLVSGADHLGDGRGFAVLDYDRDGWLDIALISTNAPRLKLLRNRLGELYKGNGSRRVKLIGSQTTATAAVDRTNRDGIGAKVWVTRKSGKRTLLHRQVGQGNVAQNSSLLWLAQPPADPAIELLIEWPSGRKSTAEIDELNDDIVVTEPTEETL